MKIKKNKRSNYDVSNMNKKDEEGEETPAKYALTELNNIFSVPHAFVCHMYIL